MAPREDGMLCPDCVWLWVQAVAACSAPTPRSLIAVDLQGHLDALANTCQVGAGARCRPSARSFVLSFAQWIRARRSNVACGQLVTHKCRRISPTAFTGIDLDIVWKWDISLRQSYRRHTSVQLGRRRI